MSAGDEVDLFLHSQEVARSMNPSEAESTPIPVSLMEACAPPFRTPPTRNVQGLGGPAPGHGLEPATGDHPVLGVAATDSTTTSTASSHVKSEAGATPTCDNLERMPSSAAAHRTHSARTSASVFVFGSAASTAAATGIPEDVSAGSPSAPRTSRDVAFLEFLMQMRNDGIVKVVEHEAHGSIEISSWEVLNVEMWWRKVNEVFPSNERSSLGDNLAFFMRLRRLGFRPFNKAPRPAKSGLDYGLRRRDVGRHGYEFCAEMLAKYGTKQSKQEAKGGDKSLVNL